MIEGRCLAWPAAREKALALASVAHHRFDEADSDNIAARAAAGMHISGRMEHCLLR